MSNIGHGTNKNVPLILWLQTSWPYIILLLAASALTGCTKYEKYSHSQTGVFYPNGTTPSMLVRQVNFWLQPGSITISQPIKIVEFGMMQYSTMDDNSKAEVARVHFSDGDCYVMTAELKVYGRIEYLPGNSGPSGIWRSFVDILYSALRFCIGATLTAYLCVALFIVAVLACLKQFFS